MPTRRTQRQREFETWCDAAPAARTSNPLLYCALDKYADAYYSGPFTLNLIYPSDPAHYRPRGMQSWEKLLRYAGALYQATLPLARWKELSRGTCCLPSGDVTFLRSTMKELARWTSKPPISIRVIRGIPQTAWFYGPSGRKVDPRELEMMSRTPDFVTPYGDPEYW